ncbi:MAG: hypothetical protein KatS3mg105_1758 [Gemmatales bacterium]|nr:MAG: hypothetical protein KatS3mg105_1758 [Gemmatales bacterium]
MASLFIRKGGPLGRYEINHDRIVLGRNPDCHIVISGTAVSRAHANIVRIDGQYFIEDMNSRNGTLVNNIPVKGRVPLRDKDTIKICDFLCTFHATSEPDPIDDSAGSSIEATLQNSDPRFLLQTQPAEKLQALLEITNNLSKTLELRSLLPNIADNLFKLYKQADRCFIILEDEQSKRLVPRVIKTRRANDETTARFSRTIIEQCVKSVQAILSEDASSDEKFAMSQSIADFRIRSVMCAPLWTQNNKGIGVIQLDTQDRSKKFTNDDLKLLMAVAAQASVALENAKLHQDLLARERMLRDLELAREVQRGFLPANPPVRPGYEFFGHYESAYQVGGDYYDFIPLPDGGVVVALGDVAGKGVAAALLMAKLSSDARFCVSTQPDLPSAVTSLNNQLNQSVLSERFVTFVAGRLDCAAHAVSLVSAGHPPPLLYQRDTGNVLTPLDQKIIGLPLGVMDGFTYEAQTIKLQPGDTVLFFSDGVTEAMNTKNEELRLEGLMRALQGEKGLGPKAVVERAVKVVKQHAAGRSQHDDLTLVAFGRL